MGLLDDPNVRANLALSAGLLGGGNFGQALGRGLGGYQSTLDDAAQQKAKADYLRSQIEENATQNAIRQSTLARQAKQDAYFFGGAQPSGSTGMSTGAQGGTQAQTAPSMGKFDEWSQQFGIPKDALVADYLNNGGKGIAEMLAKRGTPDMQVSNGYAYDKNKLGAGYLPSLATSQDGKTSMVQIGPDGLPVVSAPRGALDTFNSYQGAQASFRPIKVYNPETQREEFSSEAAVTGKAPAPMAGRSGNVQSSAYAGGDRNSANMESIRIMQGELQKPGNTPADTAALTREIKRLQMQSGITNAQLPASAGVAAGPSASEAAAAKASEVKAVDTAKADVVRDTGEQKKMKSAGEMIAATRRANELLKEGPTASGAGEMMDKIAAFFGGSTKGAETAAKLDIISGDLVNNVPRMEGPQSDGDRVEYKLQAGRAADRTIPVPQRLAAMHEIERLQSKYARLNNGADVPAKVQQPTRGAPMRGQVIDGYKFKGGNPADQSNWEKQ